MMWQVGEVHHSLVHDEDIPVQDLIPLVSWPILPADATFVEKLPQAQVNGLFEARLAAVQAQTCVRGQKTLPGPAA